jgi:hypothetical protein
LSFVCADTDHFELFKKNLLSSNAITPKVLASIDPAQTLWGQFVMHISDNPKEFVHCASALKLMSLKWDAFARDAMIHELCTEFTVALIISILTLVRGNRAFHIGLGAWLLLLSIYRLVKEYREAILAGFTVTYAWSMWNWMDVVCYIFALLVAFSHLGAFTRIHELEALLLIIGWTKLLQFLSIFSMFASHIMMIIAMLSDIIKFACVYVFFLMAYSFAFYLVLHPHSTGDDGFESLRESFLSCYRMLMGETMMEVVLRGGWFPVLLWISYSVVISLLLLNMLIAMMSSSYERVLADAKGQAFLSRAKSILRLERLMSVEKRRKMWERIFEHRMADSGVWIVKVQNREALDQW